MDFDKIHVSTLVMKYLNITFSRVVSLLFCSTTWEEHLFEITLAKSVSVGHIDVKFSVQPVCINLPNIQITLLKQHTGVHTATSTSTSADPHHVDAPIQFNMKPSTSKKITQGKLYSSYPT